MSELYYDQDANNKLIRLNKITMELPSFIRQYFISIQDMSINTQLAYAYNLRTFFRFVIEEKELFPSANEMNLSDFENIAPLTIQEYRQYLNTYEYNNRIYKNSKSGVKRALSSLNSCYKYYNRMQLITRNPVSYLVFPKINEKTITYLNNSEIENLVNVLTDLRSVNEDFKTQRLTLYDRTKLRDYALISILMGTGIRVSECASLDLNDINFDECSFKVIRKGGDEEELFFGIKVKNALTDYINNERSQYSTGNENALFLSMKNRRLSVRSIQRIIKKYAKLITSKNITPHKLRSTFATNLYNETGDIFLVADLLGHSDVNTTRKHYATVDKQKKINASYQFDKFLK